MAKKNFIVQGRQKINPDNQRILSLVVSKDIYKKLKDIAAQHNITISELSRQMIAHCFAEFGIHDKELQEGLYNQGLEG